VTKLCGVRRHGNGWLLVTVDFSAVHSVHCQ
jgi:hypothetical protein